jgi:hypothetical protein
MIEVLLLAAAFATGVDPRRIALIAGALYLPAVVAGLIAVYWLRGRPGSRHRPSLFCEGVASELRAGATLRDALAAAATSVGTSVELSHSIPMAEVAARIASEFPDIGQEIRLTVAAAARTGSDAAALFDEIGVLALSQDEVGHEVRMATAPGRATALVLIGAPLFYLVTRLGEGGLSGYLASSEQRIAATIGIGLFSLGVIAASFVLWRSGR